MLVVIGVMALMSSVLMVYGRTGERQINLFKEQARIISALSRAKYLSVSTFGKTDVPCGYGVHFEAPRTFLIFKDLPSGNCSLADKKYSGAGEIFESFGLDSVITFDQLTLSDIVFTPRVLQLLLLPIKTKRLLLLKLSILKVRRRLK